MKPEEVVDRALVTADRLFEDRTRHALTFLLTCDGEPDLDAIDDAVAESRARWAVQRTKIREALTATLHQSRGRRTETPS